MGQNKKKKSDDFIYQKKYSKENNSGSSFHSDSTKEQNLADDFCDQKNEKNYSKEKRKKHIFSSIFLILLFICSISWFFISLFFEQSDHSLIQLIENLLLVLFSILFVLVAFTSPRKKKWMISLSSFLFLCYFLFRIGICLQIISIPSIGCVDNFTGKSLIEVVKWAQKNHVSIIQDYEYSDMIPEYSIISQDVSSGTKIKDIQALTVSVSEGPNPYKEIIVPNMVSWDSERVLSFIRENHLSNVDVSFTLSDQSVDTVIEQSKSGNLARNEELKLTFSLGEEYDDSPIRLIDFTKKSEFEAIFYFKQHRIRYDLDRDFSKKITRGDVLSQSIQAGTMIHPDDEKVQITISKGPKIKVLDLFQMSLSEITDWVIQNRLKLEFSDRYDDSISKNKVVDANYQKGDIIEQGSVIKIVLSKGKLKMPKFKSFEEFRKWADHYEISYEEKHEFSDTIAAGEVISYSYQVGDTIKNQDVIVVTISDGEKLVVPDLKGLSKDEIIQKLKKLGLHYNFVYQSSDSVAKDKAIKQSISASSEVSQGTTITVTLSSGKVSKRESSSKNNSSNPSNSSSNHTTPSEEPTCVSKTYTIGRGLMNIFHNYSGYDNVKNALNRYFAENFPDVKFNIVGVDGGDATSGSYVSGIGPESEVTSCNGVTYTIEIAK